MVDPVRGAAQSGADADGLLFDAAQLAWRRFLARPDACTAAAAGLALRRLEEYRRCAPVAGDRLTAIQLSHPARRCS